MWALALIALYVNWQKQSHQSLALKVRIVFDASKPDGTLEN
jgi:hypothetical protein